MYDCIVEIQAMHKSIKRIVEILPHSYPPKMITLAPPGSHRKYSWWLTWQPPLNAHFQWWGNCIPEQPTLSRWAALVVRILPSKNRWKYSTGMHPSLLPHLADITDRAALSHWASRQPLPSVGDDIQDKNSLLSLLCADIGTLICSEDFDSIFCWSVRILGITSVNTMCFISVYRNGVVTLRLL